MLLRTEFSRKLPKEEKFIIINRGIEGKRKEVRGNSEIIDMLDRKRSK